MKQLVEHRQRFAPYGFSCETWKPREMPRADQHDEIELNYLPEGSLAYLLGGRRIRIPRGRLTVFWAVFPHQIVEFEGDSRYFVVTVPLSWFLAWGLPDHFRTQIVQGDVIADSETGKHDWELFEQWSRDVNQEETSAAAALEIQARLLRLAVNATQALCPSSDERRVDQIESRDKAEQMACFIAHNYHERLTLPEIAAQVDLHPDYASTLFRRTFGTTILQLVTRHRIAHAQRLLITSDSKVVHIAYESGFESVSRFNRAFKQYAGVTPREYRNGAPTRAKT